MKKNSNNSLTALKGVRVGHAGDYKKLQGCSVVIFDKPYPVAYKANGGTARTYDTGILEDGKSYPLKHGIFISDGGHGGLETASEVARALRENGIGWRIDKSIIPSLVGGCILSLGLKNAPFNPKYGYNAVKKISRKMESGNIGVGLGASVGKFSWTENGLCLGMKSGIGNAKIRLGSKGMICALSVVNALGNIIGYDGKVIAGNRHDEKKPKFRTFYSFSNFLTQSLYSNTTISIVGTNLRIENQEDLRKIAGIAAHGQIRAVNPINTSIDGDVIFVFSTQETTLSLNQIGKDITKGNWYKVGVDIVGQFAAQAVQESIYNACYEAETIKDKRAYKGVIPGYRDY